MLIAHGLLPDLISQLSSYSFFGIAPIFWDQNEGQFKVKKSALTCIGTVISLQLGVCLLVHDFYRQYQWSSSSSGISHSHVANNNDSGGGNGVNGGVGGGNAMEKAYNRIQRISCALLLFLVAIIHGKNMRSACALVAFLNGLIAFEQKYTGRLRLPTDWKGKLTKYFCLLVRLSNAIGPVLISVLITVSESNSPLNMFDFLSTSSSTAITDIGGDGGNGNSGSGSGDLGPTSSSSSFSSLTGNQMVERFITATIMALLNMIVWYMVLNIRGFWTCGQILIGCYGLRSALNLYSSIMTRGKLLRITKEKVAEALIYREIQLLTSLFNEIHSNSILTCLLLLSSLLQTVCLYMYVRFIATMTSPFYFVPSSWTWTSSRLFIAFMIFDAIFIAFIVFGCCAEVYVTSVQVKDQLQGHEVFERSQYLTQFFLSCPTIKLEAGSTNFIPESKLNCHSGCHTLVNSGMGNGCGGAGGSGTMTPTSPSLSSLSPSDLMNMMMTMNIGNGFGVGGGESGNVFSNTGSGSTPGKTGSVVNCNNGNFGEFATTTTSSSGYNIPHSPAMTLQTGLFDT